MVMDRSIVCHALKLDTYLNVELLHYEDGKKSNFHFETRDEYFYAKVLFIWE